MDFELGGRSIGLRGKAPEVMAGHSELQEAIHTTVCVPSTGRRSLFPIFVALLFPHVLWVVLTPPSPELEAPEC
ncbi:hypothetical protein OUZ56_013884 [Daphnia magna]|uniref:Uncharacterized protein n=1 Tax=Daphnia magna TaxID=35525 RepID=A0ABQ9Z780_9CRUS|nr:hypothetical protein OUZ56_013884 [Daphnia magna]